MKTWQKYAAEFFGTLFVVGIGTGTLIALGAPNLQADIVTVALAFGFAWIMALYTFGRVSGGHFNPALSLAMFLDRRLSPTDLIGYWIAQIAGAFAASAIFAWVLSRVEVGLSYTYIADKSIGGSVDQFSGFLAEAIFTMILVTAFLVLAKSQAHTKYLGMGISLSAITFLGLHFTGASMNPARSLAPAIVGSSYPDPTAWPLSATHGLWLFIVGPLVGAIVGWILYKFVVEGDTDLTDDLGEIKDAVV
jgi:aquaporin Z